MPSPAVNLFSTAKTVAPKGKAKKPEPNRVVVAGTELYAALDHAIKWLTGLKDTVKPSAEIQRIFVDRGVAAGGQPENFDSKEGVAKANNQLKKRPSNSGLEDIEQELCRDHAVPLGTSGGEYFFNPEHTDWVLKNAGPISKALTKIPGCPVNLLQQLPTKVIATDDSISYIFRAFAKKRVVIEQLLPLVSVIAIKPKFEGDADDDVCNEKALQVINEYLSSQEEE